MELQEWNMSRLEYRRPKTRQVQRLLHLTTAAGIITYVYLTPDPASAMTFGIRWIALPTLVVSGLAMWLWPRLRRRLRQPTQNRSVGS